MKNFITCVLALSAAIGAGLLNYTYEYDMLRAVAISMLSIPPGVMISGWIMALVEAMGPPPSIRKGY